MGPTLRIHEWKLISHFMNHDSHHMFGVDMYGVPIKKGEKQDIGERKDLVFDGTQNLVDTYIHKECNYPLWSELLPKVRRKEGGPNTKSEVK